MLRYGVRLVRRDAGPLAEKDELILYLPNDIGCFLRARIPFDWGDYLLPHLRVRSRAEEGLHRPRHFAFFQKECGDGPRITRPPGSVPRQSAIAPQLQPTD